MTNHELVLNKKPITKLVYMKSFSRLFGIISGDFNND